MYPFSGFFNSNALFLGQKDYFEHILYRSGEALLTTDANYTKPLSHQICTLLTSDFGLTFLNEEHDASTPGCEPLCRECGERKFFAVMYGELYNAEQLRQQLDYTDCPVHTTQDSEILLCGFLNYGPDFFKQMDGLFAAVLYAQDFREVYLIRDSFGTKPLFYTFCEDTLVFSTKLKSLFAFPGIDPKVDANGLNEIFSLGPARTPGNAVFKDIHEVLPGHYLYCSKFGHNLTPFWQLSAMPHEDSYETTVEKTEELITSAIKRQMKGATEIGSLLSGGIDSAIVSSVGSKVLSESDHTLTTFSFDYTQNDQYFVANSFQPTQDRPYVELMKDYLKSQHFYLECTQESLVSLLSDSVHAHDLPCMGDIDSSLYYFCGQVRKNATVVLTGECADEVFGGYPWFHRSELLTMDTFPWASSMTPRRALLDTDFADNLHMEDYVKNAYANTLLKIPYLPEESATDRSIRRTGYLSLFWFMQTLLNRMERCSSANHLIARVPFADRSLVEYIYNTPWEMKCVNGVEKHLLRTSCQKYVPSEIMHRKKSPYPKTYHPHFEELLAMQMREILLDNNCKIRPFLQVGAVEAFLGSPKDYGAPWYGQLMAGPQMISYLLQIETWLRDYHVQIDL